MASAPASRSFFRAARWLLTLARSNWRLRPGRMIGAVSAIAIGVAAVVWVSSSYESVRQSTLSWATGYIGRAHVSISSPLGRYDQIPERLLGQLRQIENVAAVAPQLLQRLPVEPWPANADAGIDSMTVGAETPAVDFYGVDPQVEFQVRSYKLASGRMLRPDDGRVCMLEERFASDHGLRVGDGLLVWPAPGRAAVLYEIIGLIDRPRVGAIQKPIALTPLSDLQRVTERFALITSADVMLRGTTPEEMHSASAEVNRVVRRVSRSAIIRSAESRVRQVEQAQTQQRLVLSVLGSVAMLTALFIILSTLSIDMVERIGQFGLMRCAGLTRAQLGLLVLFEVLPLGVLGILAGVPLGLLMAGLTVWLAPEYVGHFAISLSAIREAASGGAAALLAHLWQLAHNTGIVLGALAGLATTLLAAILPVAAAMRVSPMEAAHPRARTTSAWLPIVVGALGAAILIGQHFGILLRVQRSMWFLDVALIGISLLYFGYACLGPLAVGAIGAPAVAAAAKALALRPRLLQVQVGYTVWRSAGICCGLMVGLSLLVGIVVVNRSVTAGWQFPKQFPAAYIWSFDQMRSDAADVIEQVPGIKDYTVANAINVFVEERPAFLDAAIQSVTWFLGVQPDSFLAMGRVEFLEGDLETARTKLNAGGHIVVADDFARSRNKHVGDKVRVFFGNRVREFTVAAVVQSPALDMAAGYFQAHTEYHVVASGSVIGSIEDIRRQFGVEGVKLVLLNFDLPPEPPPPGWPAAASADGPRIDPEYFDASLPVAVRWQKFRENNVLREIRSRLGAQQAFTGTVSDLKARIDADLTRMTGMLAAVPGVAMLVAAIGVVNLMTANVAARARQLAVLRAVGATRGLVLRMVVGESLVLGLLGGGLGLALGLHLAFNVTQLMDRMWGLHIDVALPWTFVAGALVVTVVLCILAGIPPARHAARTNIVSALRVN